MNSLPALLSRINRVVFVLGIVFLASTLGAVIFVAASGNDGAVPATHFAASSTGTSTKAHIAQRFGELPLSFEVNKGQTNESVKFVSHGPGYDLFLTANEAVLSLRKPKAQAVDKSQVESSVLRLKMIGAHAAPRVEGEEELPGKVNYLVGNDREKWRRNVPTYRKVHYTDVYPGIDIVYYGNQRQLEYDFVVAAGANPKLIRFSVEGSERLRLDQEGNLLLSLKHGEARLNKPFIYQLTNDGSRSEVKGSYVINGKEIRFKVRGADSGKPLVIDPVLSYSTFLGGNGDEQAFGIAVDGQGSAYVTGTTTSNLFPRTPGAFNTEDLVGAFVTKLDPTGSTLIYSTFLSGREHGVVVTGSPSTGSTAIAVDSSGNAYVTGATTASDFPVVNPLKTSGIFFKTTDAGSTWSNNNTAPTEGLSCLAVAPTNPNIIYAGSFKGVYRSTDGGGTWTMTSTVNLPDVPAINTLAVDPTNSSIVYAGTHGLFKSTDGGNNWNLSLPFTGTLFRSIVFNPSVPSTIYAGSSAGFFRSTDNGNTWTGINTLGNPTDRDILSVAVDPTAPLIIYGGTRGHGLFKTSNGGNSWTAINNGITSGFGTNSGVIDDVVIDPANSATLYVNVVGTINKSTNGGNSWAPINNINVGIGINAMVATPSTLYVGTVGRGVIKTTDGGTSWTGVNNGLWTANIRVLAVDPSNPATLYAGGSDSVLTTDAFISKLNSTGSDLLFSTYLGGSGDDIGNGIAVDGSGNIYVAGNTKSENFPTQNAFQAGPSPTESGGNGFVTKLNPSVPSYVFSTYLGGSAKLEGGAPVSGAEVVLNDGSSISSVVTESDGSYEFSHLREGGSFTVSATKPHFTIAPPSQTFSNLNSNQTLDFTATPTNAPFFTISGQVSENGAGLFGVVVTLTGSQSGLRTTDNNGNYSFEVAGGGNYTLTPAITGFTLGPPSQTFNNLSASQTANFTATRQNIVVTNTNDAGTGSLREAITLANNTLGPDTITFNIPGTGVKVISPVRPLPEITDPVVIDAATQPGYSGTPLIELDGNNLGFQNGLVITAGNSTVRSLAIGNFQTSGIALRSCNNNVIQGNYIGIDATGTQPRPNHTGLLLTNSSNNIIGGTTAAARNVISGNATHGVEVGGVSNVIQGNFIGTNAAGTDAIPNGSNGVEIPSSSNTNNLIGGTAAGTGNLISGNNERGISIESPGNTVQGNLIGTDLTGTKKVPNLIGIHADIPNTLIGGLTPAARNIISGNGGAGVLFGNSGSKLQGNFVGTDITGTQPLSNNGGGVISDTNPLIGGDVPEARNVISGNVGFGNLVLGGSPFGPGAIVHGNYIGTDVTGTRALSSSTSTGIVVVGSNNVIGGLIPSAQNIISGNINGIQVGSFRSEPAQGNVIQGNLIGLNALGTGPLPNSQIGISFIDAFNNTVGGTQSGAANKIAFNGGAGVMSLSALSGTRMSVRGNSIFSNGQLGIDLDGDGVTANDPADTDEGANNRQNFPVLTSVISVGNDTTIQGTLNSTPNKTFQIDFYSNAALDPSGHGEGAVYFGTTSVHTDGSGNATINANFPAPLGSGRVITATATDDVGNTSEFSAGDVTSATGNVQFSVGSIQVIEDLGVVTVTVLRKGGAAGNLSIDYATVDGTATAGQDYSSTSGTLSFSGGETSKSFQIPIVDDAVTEPDETFTVELRNAPSLDALGAPSDLVVTIQDRSTVPVIGQSFESVPEGDSGTSEAFFTFNLSAATGRTVTVNFATSNGSATGGESCLSPGSDFETTSGTLSFQPGTTALTILVRICGDRSAETNETFSIDLSNPSNATVNQNGASVSIIDDDFLELLLDESDMNRPAALDAFFFVRDPFHVLLPDWFPTAGTDRNTRVMFFVRGLELNPGEPASDVIVRMGNGIDFFDVPAEDVRPVPGVDFTQVTVRLPDGIPAGANFVTIKAHSRTTPNVGVIEIAP